MLYTAFFCRIVLVVKMLITFYDYYLNVFAESNNVCIFDSSKRKEIMRTATNYTDKAAGTYGFGNNQKAVTGTENKIAIDNYGSITVQAFNQKLAKAGILGWAFFTTKKHTIWSNEYLTKCINENTDLFPVQF